MTALERRKGNICGVLQRIADENYQKLAWFNRHEEQSSPDELINQLFGDYMFDDFIDSKDLNISEITRDLSRAFSLSLNRFCKQTPEFLDPQKVLDDPRWHRIREDAQALVKHLRENSF